MADIIPLGKVNKRQRIPVIVTHDTHGYVRIPPSLLFRDHDEAWFQYCHRLWVGVYEANGRDDIQLTVHLKLSDSDRMIHELNQWAFYAGRIDGGMHIPRVNERLAGLMIHGVKFKLDLGE